MNLKNLIFLVFILLFSGFNYIKPENKSVSNEKGTILYHTKFLFADSDKVTSYECEDFVSDALNNYTIPIIKHEFIHILNCSRTSVINSHDSEVTDTIYTFSNLDNVIQIYRSNQNDFIFTFDVTDPRFMLSGNIKPGMTKEDFSQIFQITGPLKNNVQIINSESSMKFMFYFQNNRLKRINSYLYLD